MTFHTHKLMTNNEQKITNSCNFKTILDHPLLLPGDKKSGKHFFRVE